MKLSLIIQGNIYELGFLGIRKVESKIQPGKFTLPANANVCINVMALRHAPQIWGEDVRFSSQRAILLYSFPNLTLRGSCTSPLKWSSGNPFTHHRVSLLKNEHFMQQNRNMEASKSKATANASERGMVPGSFGVWNSLVKQSHAGTVIDEGTEIFSPSLR
ncbi:hypothetical protein SADUNF_Sadunf10G0105900 [Salix dunnii]|uniref:Uncharacterized protein n=1 Tax=Salix dunnii TaxID=1413687 RepID=A0A835JVQ8_9ROSI|nr:hypothetical protein SADUNF_Sadunf10G0105900 [Salix dunnii]